MISLKNVDKYFYRHKKNEIHVVDNTSLELGNTGLVALLGPSGSGKTTLLNCIGGLDRYNRGAIYYDGKKLPRGISSKRDAMRTLNIGYIFQNYNLLDNLTVFENVALSLKMIGFKNKLEIKKRVEYVLESVGMYRYRNKPAGMLSGGERQRVGIARAIVKNPRVIIADEPTGNLDSKNTIEIMNIIKSISMDRLVILVTHETTLANFYASRIVTLEDGKITSDKKNDHENELDYRIDNKIYLQDFKHKDVMEDGIQIFRNEKNDISLDIAVQNGNIYIKSRNNAKIEIVDEHSGVEFVDGKYKKISKDDYEKSAFDLKELDNSKHKLKYTSIYNTGSMLKTGFKKVLSYSMMKKVLLLGFFAAAMFIVYAMSSIFGITDIKDKNFIEVDREYIKVSVKNTVETFDSIKNVPGVSYVLPGDSIVEFSIKNDTLFQLKDASGSISGALMDIEHVQEEDLIYGKMPESDHDVILTKLTIDRAKTTDPYLKTLDLKEYKDFIGKTLDIGEEKFTIVGISSKEEPDIYINKNYMMYVVSIENDQQSEAVIKNYNLAEDIKIQRGRAPQNDYEVIVSIDNKDFMPLYKTIDTKVNGKKLKVVGYYFSALGKTDYYVNENTYDYDTIVSKKNMMVYGEDKNTLIETLKSSGYNAEDTYHLAKEQYIHDSKDNIIEALIIAGILLAISFVEIFLMIRASFLSRIKEVGTYRAIGTKKGDIYKMFLGEILVITTIAGLPGIVLMSLIMNEVTKISFFSNMYAMNLLVIASSTILVYLLNILIGLLPVRSTIRKTPAEILSRNDVD